MIVDSSAEKSVRQDGLLQRVLVRIAPKSIDVAILARFDEDESLGIASGSCFEARNGVWGQRHVTGTTVWGASRAYRWECLQAILPLEERIAWDGIDEFKANSRGRRLRRSSSAIDLTRTSR